MSLERTGSRYLCESNRDPPRRQGTRNWVMFKLITRSLVTEKEVRSNQLPFHNPREPVGLRGSSSISQGLQLDPSRYLEDPFLPLVGRYATADGWRYRLTVSSEELQQMSEILPTDILPTLITTIMVASSFQSPSYGPMHSFHGTLEDITRLVAILWTTCGTVSRINDDPAQSSAQFHWNGDAVAVEDAWTTQDSDTETLRPTMSPSPSRTEWIHQLPIDNPRESTALRGGSSRPPRSAHNNDDEIVDKNQPPTVFDLSHIRDSLPPPEVGVYPADNRPDELLNPGRRRRYSHESPVRFHQTSSQYFLTVDDLHQVCRELSLKHWLFLITRTIRSFL